VLEEGLDEQVVVLLESMAMQDRVLQCHKIDCLSVVSEIWQSQSGLLAAIKMDCSLSVISWIWLL